MEATKQQRFRLTSGSHEAQGPRKTMEDTHKRIDNIHAEDIQLKQYNYGAYYGVYDGHGGAQTAEMVVDRLHMKIFSSDLFISGDIEGAIRTGFQEMDKYVVEEANKQNSMHGCTCVCTLVLDEKVYFANIGDSEGILVSVSDGAVTAKNMTKAHKANEPSEKERIESMGGHVFFGRVYGSLAVSRSFGDAKYKRPKTSKDFVSWEPFIKVDTLGPSHKYMILACDGLFDVMNHQEVAEMTHKLFEEGQDPNQVAKALVVRAVRDLQTEDNVTVIIVKIDWATDGNGEIPETHPHTDKHTPDSEPVKENIHTMDISETTGITEDHEKSTPATPPVTPVQTPPQETDKKD